MYLFLLIISLLALLCLNIVVFSNDLLSPSVVVCGVFLLSSLCSWYNVQYWKFNLQKETYTTIICGLTLFSIISLITSLICNKFMKKDSVLDCYKLNKIVISNFKLYILIIAVFFLSLWYAVEIFRIAIRYGYVSSISDMTSIYRRVSSYGVLSVEDSINFICKQLYKFVPAIAHIFVYIFINNTIVSGKIKGQLRYLLPCILYILFSLLSGGRMQVLRLFSAALFMYYILYMKNNGNHLGKIRTSIKFLFIALIGLIVFCIFFFLVKELVGRKSDKDLLYYITFYAGGSIPLLDSFLKDPPPPSNIWGKETFFAINSFIGRYFNIKELQYIVHHEFRSAPTGVNMGNVYTVFRRLIYDFGYGGMMFGYSLCSIIYTVAYKKIKHRHIKSKIDLGILYYCYISFGLTMQFYEESFYVNVISVGTALTFGLIYLCKFFLIKVSYGRYKN